MGNRDCIAGIGNYSDEFVGTSSRNKNNGPTLESVAAESRYLAALPSPPAFLSGPCGGRHRRASELPNPRSYPGFIHSTPLQANFKIRIQVYQY